MHKFSLPERENKGDTSETRTRDPKVTSHARYHCATPAALEPRANIYVIGCGHDGPVGEECGTIFMEMTKNTDWQLTPEVFGGKLRKEKGIRNGNMNK